MNKKNILLVAMIFGGILLGAVIANFCKDISFLQWLSYGKTLGLSTEHPMIIDFSVLKIAFGFEVGINIAQIICIVTSVLLWRPLAKKF